MGSDGKIRLKDDPSFLAKVLVNGGTIYENGKIKEQTGREKRKESRILG